MDRIEVVDLNEYQRGSAEERAAFVRRLGAGLEQHGFVTVSNHGIPQDELDAAFACIERLFALPLADKERCVVPESLGNRGYVGYGRERAVGASVADLKEFWHVGQEVVRPEHRPYYAPNAWPEHPSVADFRPRMLALFARFEAVARVALEAIADYLALPRGHFADMIADGNSILRLIHYPPVPEDAPPDAVRAAAHADINLITLLAEGTTGGLELLRRDGTWMPVRSLGGQLVLDAGDMMELCTNGRIPSTTHRVVNPDGLNVARYSMPFFVHPRPEVVLAPAPGTVTETRPARYTPIAAHAFLEQRLRAIGA